MKTRAAAFAVVAALAISACGDDKDTTATTAPATRSSASATGTKGSPDVRGLQIAWDREGDRHRIPKRHIETRSICSTAEIALVEIARRSAASQIEIESGVRVIRNRRLALLVNASRHVRRGQIRNDIPVRRDRGPRYGPDVRNPQQSEHQVVVHDLVLYYAVQCYGDG